MQLLGQTYLSYISLWKLYVQNVWNKKMLYFICKSILLSVVELNTKRKSVLTETTLEIDFIFWVYLIENKYTKTSKRLTIGTVYRLK